MLPLLSLCLALLMALFKDTDTASKVSSQTLSNLIRHVAIALLDKRFSSAEELSKTAGEQMGRALNKVRSYLTLAVTDVRYSFLFKLPPGRHEHPRFKHF